MDLAAVADRHRLDSGAPALAAAVVRSDAIDAATVGVRRADGSTPVSPGDRFHLGSNTKAITATAAAVLVERGVLAWDSSAAEVLDVHAADPSITLERLLRHAAGIRPLTEDEELDALGLEPGEPTEERLAAARLLLADPPALEPKTGIERYSNGGYTIAASMLECAAGRPYEEVVEAEVFGPLGFEAAFGWPAGGGADQPWGHFADGDGSLRPHDPDDDYRLGAVLAPAGDVNSAIEPYARFVQAHLRGLRGTSSILSAATFAHLHTPDDEGFALGWGVQEFEGARTSTHSGSAETFYAVVVIQPDRDLAVAVCANAAGASGARGVVELTRELVRSSS
jgi:CubicO group peptidase (beta-lactamase class C family)